MYTLYNNADNCNALLLLYALVCIVAIMRDVALF